MAEDERKTPPQILLGQTKIEIVVKRHATAKRLILRCDATDNQVIVTAPRTAELAQIVDFVKKHKNWVENALAQQRVAMANTRIGAGATLPILGIPRRICHIDGRGLTRLGEDNQLLVFGGQEFLPRRVKEFLVKEAERQIKPIIADFTTCLDRRVKRVCFQDTISRWGSCSSSGRLCFNWRIVMAPPHVIRYLVAHETSHLIEMNHSQKFWHICAQLAPDYKQCRTWLRRHGRLLLAMTFS